MIDKMMMNCITVGSECELMVSPVSQSFIRGEVNIIRYFAR